MTRLPYPPTRLDDAVELLHGEAISDPYRWLEDGASAETQVPQRSVYGPSTRPVFELKTEFRPSWLSVYGWPGGE